MQCSEIHTSDLLSDDFLSNVLSSVGESTRFSDVFLSSVLSSVGDSNRLSDGFLPSVVSSVDSSDFWSVDFVSGVLSSEEPVLENLFRDARLSFTSLKDSSSLDWKCKKWKVCLIWVVYGLCLGMSDLLRLARYQAVDLSPTLSWVY